MSVLIDRSKGQEHIYRELCRIRDEVGLEKMDMVQRLELQFMEIDRKKEKQKEENEYRRKYWAERDRANRLKAEMEEMKQQIAFNEAVEKAVAERLGKTATETEAAEAAEGAEAAEMAEE